MVQLLSPHRLFWYLLAGLATVHDPASCLTHLRVHIPETVQRGSDVIFNCSFLLQDDELYAIKWYRGNHEILRFVPKEDKPLKIFPLPGYNISKTASTGRSLYLTNAEFVNSGNYTCEVIADTTFHTLVATKSMLVIDLPDERPRITNVNKKYEVGDTVQAMCTSWQSNPPAELTWFINNGKARSSYLRKYDLRVEHDGTFTSVLGLHFNVSSHHFQGGNMILKCTSSLLAVYWQSTEIRIKEASPQLRHVVDEPAAKTPKTSNKKNLQSVGLTSSSMLSAATAETPAVVIYLTLNLWWLLLLQNPLLQR